MKLKIFCLHQQILQTIRIPELKIQEKASGAFYTVNSRKPHSNFILNLKNNSFVMNSSLFKNMHNTSMTDRAEPQTLALRFTIFSLSSTDEDQPSYASQGVRFYANGLIFFSDFPKNSKASKETLTLSFPLEPKAAEVVAEEQTSNIWKEMWDFQSSWSSNQRSQKEKKDVCTYKKCIIFRTNYSE